MELGLEFTIALGDVMLFDGTVVHTAHNPNSEPAVLMEAQLRAGDRPLTEFIPELAPPVAWGCSATLETTLSVVAASEGGEAPGGA